MGQYYMPTIITENNINTVYSWDYGNGLKLMEHSWIGNNFVNAVSSLIWKSPARVAWIGDYSEIPYDADGLVYTKEAYMKIPNEDFLRYYEAAWGDDSVPHIKPNADNILNLRHKERYLINHTQKCYIRFGDYIERAKYTPSWDNVASCVHTLPLLTACGNDRVGGDFHSGNEGYEHVGEWAFDMLEFSDRKPKGYSVCDYIFKEE